MWNDQLLVARRLVEAGARCVTVAYGFWDTHGDNFGHLRSTCPLFDQGISALVEDIHMRGLDKDVTVVVWGEFGRTPKINKVAGRDHWAPVNGAFLAGGGMKVGQVIGSTDKLGGYAASRPIHYQDVLATVYHNLGIDPHAFVSDPADRPVPILPPDRPADPGAGLRRVSPSQDHPDGCATHGSQRHPRRSPVLAGGRPPPLDRGDPGRARRARIRNGPMI